MHINKWLLYSPSVGALPAVGPGAGPRGARLGDARVPRAAAPRGTAATPASATAPSAASAPAPAVAPTPATPVLQQQKQQLPAIVLTSPRPRRPGFEWAREWAGGYSEPPSPSYSEPGYSHPWLDEWRYVW